MFIGRRMSHSGETDDTSRLLTQVIQQQEIFLKRQPCSAEMGAEAMKYLGRRGDLAGALLSNP